MANTIKLKRGSGSDPGASDLAVGEIAIRTDEGKIFTKKDDGSVAEISGSGGGGTNFTYLALRNAANNGAASYPGNDFTLVTDGTTNAVSPTAANTLLLSYGGVIQQPNSGTSTSGITGFIIDGSRLKTATNFAAAPDFIIYQKGAGIGTPSDDTVDLAQLAHATQGDVLYYGASGAPARLAADNGKFLRSNGNSSNPSWETVTSTPEGTAILSTGESGGSKYLREDGDGSCSWQSVPAGVGGANGVDFNDDVKARFGTGNDLEIYHLSDVNIINATAGTLSLRHDNEMMVQCGPDAAVELYHDGTKKFETTSSGSKTYGELHILDGSESTNKLTIGDNDDFDIWHETAGTFIRNHEGYLAIQNADDNINTIFIRGRADENGIKVIGDGAVELYYDNELKLITTSTGITVKDTSAAHSWLGLESTDGVCGYLVGQSNAGSGSEKAVAIYNAAGNETHLRGINNGAVELYFDNSKKLETTSSGLAITGNQTTTLAIQAQGIECPATVSANWTIGANNNAVFPGPMTVASGVTVTVPANRTLTIV